MISFCFDWRTLHTLAQCRNEERGRKEKMNSIISRGKVWYRIRPTILDFLIGRESEVLSTFDLTFAVNSGCFTLFERFMLGSFAAATKNNQEKQQLFILFDFRNPQILELFLYSNNCFVSLIWGMNWYCLFWILFAILSKFHLYINSHVINFYSICDAFLGSHALPVASMKEITRGHAITVEQPSKIKYVHIFKVVLFI